MAGGSRGSDAAAYHAISNDMSAMIDDKFGMTMSQIEGNHL